MERISRSCLSVSYAQEKVHKALPIPWKQCQATAWFRQGKNGPGAESHGAVIVSQPLCLCHDWLTLLLLFEELFFQAHHVPVGFAPVQATDDHRCQGCWGLKLGIVAGAIAWNLVVASS